MKLMLALVMMAVIPAAWAAPALQVEQVDGKPVIRAVASKLAAWRPEQDALIVVVPANSGGVEIGNLPAGMKAEKLTQGGLVGIVLKGTNGSWQVVHDGANWLVRPGPGMKAESILMLRDGWRVGGEMVVPQSLTAMGKHWQVGMVGKASSVAGSVAGAVKLGAGAPVVVAPAVEVARVEEVKAIVPVVVAPAEPALKVLPVPGTVKVEAAEPLRPLGQPMMAASVLPTRVVTANPRGGMQAVSLSQMLARIEPASGPMPAAERALPGPAAMVLPTRASASAVAESGLARVVVQPGPAMRPLGMGKVVEDLLPQVLGDVYLPGTLVSLTLPDFSKEPDATKAEHSPTIEDMVATAHPAAVSLATPTEVISASEAVAHNDGTWNQDTLAPIKAAMEQAKVSASEVALVKAAAVAEVKEVEVLVGPAISRILPQREGVYQDEVSNALQGIVEMPKGSSREYDAQMNLAALYLAWQRPEEALAVLAELPTRADGLPASPQARLFTAVAQLARGGSLTPGLLDLGGNLGSHAKLWQAVAASQKGDYATALKLWPQERGILPQYPSYLREIAQQAQANALVMVGDRKLALQVLDQLVKGYSNPDEAPVGLTRLSGLVRLGTSEESRGLELLAKAAEDMRDPMEAYRAKFEFVKALQQRRDLSDEQVRKYMTDLWFDWRGDDLERDVLDNLADLYDKQGEFRQALQYWQTLVQAYPKSTDLGRITERMTDAFLRVFDPENPKIYDTIAYVGLYYDFSELVPNDGRGDMVQEQVARLLVQANLWKRAIPILEQQLEHRPLDASAQGRLVLMLAEAYGNTGHAADGIKLIDKWQRVATTAVLARSWKLEEARLMLQLNRPATSTKALASLPMDDREATRLKVEAAWAAKDWTASVPLLQNQLANIPASQLISDTGAQLATFRLAYAYGQLRDGPNLDALSKRYESGLARLPQLSDGVSAVAAGTGVSASVVASGPLAPLTTALNSLNRMTERVERVRGDVAAERKQLQEYNDKMRYMELLPPPAI